MLERSPDNNNDLAASRFPPKTGGAWLSAFEQAALARIESFDQTVAARAEQLIFRNGPALARVAAEARSIPVELVQQALELRSVNPTAESLMRRVEAGAWAHVVLLPRRELFLSPVAYPLASAEASLARLSVEQVTLRGNKQSLFHVLSRRLSVNQPFDEFAAEILRVGTKALAAADASQLDLYIGGLKRTFTAEGPSPERLRNMILDPYIEVPLPSLISIYNKLRATTEVNPVATSALLHAITDRFNFFSDGALHEQLRAFRGLPVAPPLGQQVGRQMEELWQRAKASPDAKQQLSELIKKTVEERLVASPYQEALVAQGKERKRNTFTLEDIEPAIATAPAEKLLEWERFAARAGEHEVATKCFDELLKKFPKLPADTIGAFTERMLNRGLGIADSPVTARFLARCTECSLADMLAVFGVLRRSEAVGSQVKDALVAGIKERLGVLSLNPGLAVHLSILATASGNGLWDREVAKAARSTLEMRSRGTLWSEVAPYIAALPDVFRWRGR